MTLSAHAHANLCQSFENRVRSDSCANIITLRRDNEDQLTATDKYPSVPSVFRLAIQISTISTRKPRLGCVRLLRCRDAQHDLYRTTIFIPAELERRSC
jgi:hypothetical protein